jgi:hypothetical protein
MRTVQVYIEGQRLHLFNDETISVTSKQQDIQDISKVFTDFSQSFSVPSTPSNDAIFQHFYQNDVDSTIDHNIRRSAFIEIDLTTFRTGTISLEKAEIKDNQAYSYQITFYGDITSLKDKFGDSKLNELTYLNIHSHDYSGAEIQDRITDGSTNYAIRWPLITQRFLTYGDGGANDISPSGGISSIAYTELFPAIDLRSIFIAIEIKYGIDLQGTFLSDKRFTNCFLYCQNKDSFQFLTGTQAVDLTSISQDVQTGLNPFVCSDYVDLANNTINIQELDLDIGRHVIRFNVISQSTVSGDYFIRVFENDVLISNYQGSQPNPYLILDTANTSGLNSVYRFEVQTTEAMDLDYRLRYEIQGQFEDPVTGQPIINTNFCEIETNTTSYSANISILPYLPDMKIADFFTAVLKEFNLTCYGIAEDVFQVEPLDDWYSKGAIVDITQYTDIKSINVERIKLFKFIEFKYEQSENILNNQFRELFGREYGDVSITFDYDGGEYKIEQPFENMHMQKFTNTNLQVGFTVDKDLNTYTPKPMLLYMYDETSEQVPFFNGTTTNILTEYMPFGQDVKVNNTNFTLNFNYEISTLLLQAVPNTLYEIYYKAYLQNLYKLKNRRLTVKTNLPVSLLTNLRLNDRVIIRDKRYIIETIKSNLNTGEVDFVLINDFRPILVEQLGTGEPLRPNKDAQDVEVRILFPNDAASARISTTTSGVTISPSNISSESIVTVSIPDNPNATTVLKTEDDVDYINTENTNRIRIEGGTVELITLNVEYTYINGTQTTSQIYIQQQP